MTQVFELRDEGCVEVQVYRPVAIANSTRFFAVICLKIRMQYRLSESAGCKSFGVFVSKSCWSMICCSVLVTSAKKEICWLAPGVAGEIMSLVIESVEPVRWLGNVFADEATVAGS